MSDNRDSVKLDEILRMLKRGEVVFPIAPRVGMSWRFDATPLFQSQAAGATLNMTVYGDFIDLEWRFQGMPLIRWSQPYRVELPPYLR